MSTDAGERSRDLHRFVTFVDAVVAIAITLLVLPLVDEVSSVGEASTVDVLRDVRPELLAFLLSFVVISRLWRAQHRVMGPVLTESRAVNRLLMSWTLTIVLLPFPTALVAESSDERGTLLLYVGTLAVSSAVVTVLAHVVRRDPAVRATGRAVDPLQSLVTTLGFVVTLVVSGIWPAAGYWPLLLVALDGPIARLVRTRRPPAA